MMPYERYKTILSVVEGSDFVSIHDLIRRTNSSIATLRRDISYLVDKGKVGRVRGGIVSRNDGQRKDFLHLYRNREKEFKEEKTAIGRAAQNFLDNNDIILLTDGTTTSQVARHIDGSKHLTVITNGLDVVSHLRERPNIEVILLGGIVDFTYNVITGHSVSRMLEELNPTKLIMGAGGITREKGITCYDFMQSAFLSRVIREVATCIIVADHSKFDRNVLVQVGELRQVHAIVTDKGVPSKYLELFRDMRIDAVVV